MAILNNQRVNLPVTQFQPEIAMVIRSISDENTARNVMDSSLGENNHCYFCWFWLPNNSYRRFGDGLSVPLGDGNLLGFHNSLLSLEFFWCSTMSQMWFPHGKKITTLAKE